MMHCLLQKSQHLRLLFIKQYMNSNRVLPKRVKKKKKKTKQKQKRKTQTWIQNVDPNIHFIKNLSEIILILLVAFTFTGNHTHIASTGGVKVAVKF